MSDEARYAHEWKPRNLGGRVYYDPREELTYWAGSTSELMVAVPVATLRAAAAVRVCRSSTVLVGDEYGPYLEPITVHCEKPREHLYDHSNGAVSWRA